MLNQPNSSAINIDDSSSMDSALCSSVDLVSDVMSYVQYFCSDYDTWVRILLRYFVTSLIDQAYLVDTHKVRIRLLTYKTRI